VKIAPPAYSDAAPIIPLLACGFVAYGAFVIAYRVSRYPKRRRDYPVLAVVAALVAVAGCLVLIPPFGSYGAAAAVIVAPVSAAAVILWRSQHGRAPVPFDWWRMAAAVALAGGLYAAEHALGSTAVAVATPFAFVVLVIGLGIVPREHLDPLRRVARGALATDLRGSTLAARLGALRSDDRAVLDAVVLRGDGPAEAARSLRVSEVEVQERTARALAAIAGVAPERLTQEAEVGHLLLADIPLAERDVRARALCERGVDPRTLDDLITARDVLRRRRRRVWRLAARQVA
ncbi:MAG TPA: polysaccharide biosynthesis C-terminal domain-containing protein, partial [Solirubrobacteraceae bacterium]|nr:polysaccharide biosynthesis C-terminal domain-containing protein [Solirubrobacteraceae bacterium]